MKKLLYIIIGIEIFQEFYKKELVFLHLIHKKGVRKKSTVPRALSVKTIAIIHTNF